MNAKRMSALVLAVWMALDGFSAATTYTATEDGRTWSYALDQSGNATLMGVDDAAGALTLPSSLDGHAVTTVGEKSFQNLSQLQVLRIPDSVTSVGYGAFGGCTSLGEVVLGNGVTSFGGYSGTSTGYDDHGVFNGCTSLTNVAFGSGLRTLNGHAFANCTKLARVILPDEVETVANNCFYGCTSLREVVFGRGIKGIGDYSFRNCTALTRVTFAANDAVQLAIGSYAFNGCSSLTELLLPDSLKTIDEYAFANCVKLPSLRFPDSVTTIGMGAFGGCTSLGEVVLGNGVTSFGGYSGTSTGYDDHGVFNGCTSLTNVAFGSGLRTIGGHAFANCTKLTRVDIPDGVETIANNCFYGCTSLTKVTIGNGVTSIGKYAFAMCPALRSLNIGAAILTISDNAFNGVSSLRYIYFHGLKPPTLGANVFAGAPAAMVVYVADGGTGWNGTEPGLPEKWNGFTIKWGSTYSPSADAPYDLSFTKPAGWPASAFLTSTSTGLVAQTRFLAGDTIYLRYAFKDAWADENIVAAFTNGIRVTDLSVEPPLDVLDLADPQPHGCPIGTTVQRTVKIEGLEISDSYLLNLKLDEGECVAETDEDNNTNSCAFAVVPSVAVTFVSEDNEYAVVRYLKGGTFDTLPAPPQRWGFDFRGWYTAEEGGNLVAQGSPVPYAPTTLYARWDVHVSQTIEVTGDVSANTTWKFGDVYVVRRSMKIARGAKLTVEPGAIVKLAHQCEIEVQSGGSLNAEGTRALPIIFTSLKDDEYGGDTNGDGDESSPAPGDWDLIRNSGTIVMNYCKVLWCSDTNNSGALNPESGSWLFRNSIVAHCKYDNMRGGYFTAENSIFADGSLGVAPRIRNAVFKNCVFTKLETAVRWGRGQFYNCVFSDITKDIIDTKFDSSTLNSQFYNCIFWSPEATGDKAAAKVGKNNCIYADPLFLDPENGNFRVAANSPCIDAGLGEFAPERDYYGQPRMEVDGVRKSGTVAGNGKVPDIGIYEVPGGSDVPAADLVVTAVSAPEELSVGGTAKISWTVANNGTYEAFAGWRDAVELVTANGQSVLLGTFMGDVDLAPGKTANFSLTATIPSALEGACTVRVTANKYRDVFECFAYDNNAADAAPSVLTAGEVTLPTSGDAYPLALAAGCETAFRLGNATDQAAVIVVRSEGEFSAWLGNGAVATRDNAIRSAVKIADDTWLLQVASGEEPRISVANEGESAATCELSLAIGEFFLLDTGKVSAGNGGPVSLAFYGNGFDDAMSCWLTQGSVRIDAVSAKVDDAVSATAIFDLMDAAPGDYMLHVKKGDDEATATVLSVVQTKVGAKWNCSVDIAESIRPSRVYVGRLNYSNDGDTAMGAPYVRLTSNKGTLIRLSEADAWGTSIELMAASDTYPAGTLKPGDSSRVSFFYMTTADAAEITYAYTLSSDEAFPWAEAKTEMKPASVTDEAWSHAFRTLRANLGETWNDYLERMRTDCDHLQAIGSPVKRLDRIWQLEIADAMGTDAAVPTLATATDLARSARGLGLSFVRAYSSSMSKRFDSGILGYGWADNYSSYVEQMDAETLIFHLPSGGSYGFTKASGSWQPEDARDKTVLTETDVAYVLTYASGIVQTFAKSNMKTATIADNQGRALTFTYAGDMLTRVAHTDGAVLDFAYSGGKLVSATDDQGRTTTYGYTGDLLTTVTAYNGLVTRYEYQTATGTPNDRALTRIVYPDGTTKEFAYDAKGLLAETSVNGGQQPTRIVRNPLGSYTLVAPNGGETHVTVGANGETLKTVNALGETVKQVYTADSLLESTVAPSGKRNKVIYDKQGSPIASMSASGATTTFAYTYEFDNLASVTDAKGHAFITYGYDELGRSTSVGYADGSASTLEYNEKGDVVKSTNRRGESVVYEYDDEGNLVRKTWDNGRTFTLAYDDRGNVTNATDSVTGTVTMEYDANERLTRIVHPKNRGFTFKYDAAGRQIERTSLDGSKECYGYDAFGRLARVTDGASAYLTNAYDPMTGWLLTQTYGNGTVVSNAYDILGRTIGIYHLKNGTRLAFFEYAYDADGKCLSQTTAEGVERYTYDADGQLTGVTYPDGTSETFAYDAVGNRTVANGETYTVNELNQYTSISTSTSTSFAYDLDGNLTSRTDADGTTTYAYDTLNRLVAVTNEAKNIRWSCEYDVFGNRTSVTDNGTTTEKLFIQGSLASVAAEYVNNAQMTRHIVVGSVRLADIGGATRYYHADLLGSTRLTTDASGTQQGTASYKAFGALRKSSGTQTDAGYVGTLGIETDANGFLFMRNRYYDADMGRFVQMDPIEIAGDDENFYSYCFNDAFISDPSGLKSFVGAVEAIDNRFGSGDIVTELAKESAWNVAENYAQNKYTSAAFNSIGGGKKITITNNGNVRVGMRWLKKNSRLYKDVARAGKIGKGLGVADKIYKVGYYGAAFFTDLMLGDFDQAGRDVEDAVVDYVFGFVLLAYDAAKWVSYKITSWIVQSCDPNEISGPLGTGEGRYVLQGEWMNYTIYFENKTNATAAAQEITVTLPMDPGLDWSTLELGEIAFGEHIDMGLSGKRHGNTSYALPGTNTSVKTEVSTVGTNLVWYLRIYDPTTLDNFPDDPRGGFLPPNDPETHCGEGHLSYRVKVTDTTPNGTVIRASADIQFDTNEHIETDPSWWNTVGVDMPAIGEYVSLDLVEDLGIEIPDVDYAAGDKVTVKVEGLAKGLKLVTTQQKETTGRKAVTNVVYTIEGVPTEAVDFDTQAMYARVTVTYKDKTMGDKGKAETLQPIELSIVPAKVRTLAAGVLNEVYEPVDIAELWPEVADAKVNPTEWSFKGWPAGVKYNATAKDVNWSYKSSDGKSYGAIAVPYTVYGQPTKAGEFPITATWKHKLDDDKTTVSETFSAVLTVWGDVESEDEFRYTDRAYVATATKALDATWKSFSGLPTGIKYTTKLIAADTKKGAPEYPAYSLYGTPTKAGVFAVTATKVDPNDAKKTVKETFLWKVDPATAPAFALDTGTAPIAEMKAQIVQGANQSFAITASEGAKVSVSGLPSGLKLVQDKTTGLYSVEGVATKPGEYFVTFKTVLNGVTTVTTTAFTVKANPFTATYCGYTCAGPAAGASKRLAVAEVTVAAAGTVKLTYTEGKTKYTASVKSFGWDDVTGKGTVEGLVLKVSSADKQLGYGDRKATVTFEDFGTYLKAKLDIADADGALLNGPANWFLYATVKTTEVPLPASQTFVFQYEDGGIVDAIATVSVAYDANKATAAFSGKLFDGTAVKATVPVIRVYDEGSSWDYSFAPFLVIAKDGTVYCFNTFYCWDGGYVDWVAEHGMYSVGVGADYAEYTSGDKKFAELVPETGAFTFGWGSDTAVVGESTESFAFEVTTDANGNPNGVAIYDIEPQPDEKPLATVTAKVGKTTGAISVSFTSKKGDKAKYAVELAWQGEKLFAGHVTRTWKGLVDNKSANLTAYGTAEVK